MRSGQCCFFWEGTGSCKKPDRFMTTIKHSRWAVGMTAAVLMIWCLGCQAPRSNSSNHAGFKPGEVWLDTAGQPISAHGGGMLFYNGTYYWYGENKEGRSWMPESNKSWDGYRVDVTGIRCYSSKDLLHWKDEGLVLKAVTADPASDLHPSKVCERPKVLFNPRTKKFVMWMHIDSEDYKAARAGVAVADRPTGPFTYLGSVRPEGQDSRDQTLFQDDDGKAYRIYSSENNDTTYISLLTDDYLRHSGRFVRVFEKRRMEAQAVFKYAGKYWFIGSDCTGWDPNPARSAVADSIWGPWTELGNPCRGQGAAETFGDQSAFVFPVAGKTNAFIFMADRWNKTNLVDSRYLWLPLQFKNHRPLVEWTPSWDLSFFALHAGSGNTPAPTRKKGVGLFDYTKVANLDAGWYYDWWPYPTGPMGGNRGWETFGVNDQDAEGYYAYPHSGIEWVPTMNSTTPSQSVIAYLVNGRKKGMYKNLLGHNEPENQKLTPQAILDAWPAWQATGLRMGSPSFLKDKNRREFINKAKQMGCRVDFVNVHWYYDFTDPDIAQKTRDWLMGIRKEYNLPIWITETGPVDVDVWYGAGTRKGPLTEEKAIAAMKAVNDVYERLDFVERYAYFNGGGEYRWGQYYDRSGLTVFGTAFKKYMYEGSESKAAR